MQPRIQGENYQLTLVCIDRYENMVPEGRIYNASVQGAVEFHSLTEFLRKMESMLDGMQYPQAFVAMRSFGETGATPEHTGEEKQKREGECATFTVRVLFRQNASWQGSVFWLEGGKEENFRSALELIFLMDSALRQEK